MAVRIRLKRLGAKKAPFYRIVVADSRTSRNGRSIEEIGIYDPTKEPVVLKVDAEAANKWLANGAQPSDTVKALLKKAGVIGEDIYRIMELGADGVQMGTRFVTTEECDASTEFKRSYIEASQQDIEIIQSPVGMPGRAIHNSFLERVKQGLKQPKSCPFNCIKTCDVTHSPYCIIMALYNAFKGNLSAGYAFAGVNAWRAEKIESVKELMTNLIDEFDRFSLKKQLAKLKK